MKKYLPLILFFFSSYITNAQWVACNMPAGTSAFSLAIKGDMLILGTLNNGIWISSDKGNTWTEKNNGITNKQIWSLSVIDNYIFAGTASGGVFRSSDNGDGWTAANTNIPTTTVIRNFVKFDNKIFASSTNKGIYVSGDNGSTWNQNNTGITGLVALPLLVTETDLFCGVLQGVFRYNKATSDWTKVSNGIPNNTISALTWFKDSQGNKKIFAGISSSVNQVVKTVNNGENWVLAESGLAKVPVATLVSKSTSIFAGNDYGVYHSANGGDSWSDVSTGFPGASYASFLTTGTAELYVIQSAKVWKRKYTEFGITTSVKSETQNPAGIVLEPNFPNPFHSETTIRYQLKTGSHIILKLYDVIGKELHTLVNEEQQPGFYQYRVDAGTLNNLPGLYYYRLSDGQNTLPGKMILK